MRPVLSLLLLLSLSIVVAPHPAAAAPPGYHITFLPQASEVGPRGLVPGEPPGAAHPRGTVLVGWSLERLGPAVTEWDLARGRVVRQSVFGWPGGGAGLARTGNVLHVLASDDHRVRYARLDADTLRVTCHLDVGEGSPGALASDGALTAIGWQVERDGHERDLHVTLVDARCERQGQLFVPSSKDRLDLAVMGGRVYGAVHSARRSWLLSIAPNATVEKGVPLDVPEHFTMTADGSRLLLLAENELLEVSPALDVVGRHPVAAPRTAFLAVAADGRMLTSDGDVLSPAFARVGHFPPSEMLPMIPVWVGDVPVLLSTDLMPLHHVSLAWVDPGAPELGAAPSPAP